MADEPLYTVTCDNLFHRGPAGGPGFAPDRERGVAFAEVERGVAAKLLEENPEGYDCPALAESPDAPSSKENTPEEDGRSVTEVSGIGPKTAGDLEDAGVETLGGLVERDAKDVAEKVGQSQSVVETWKERAAEQFSG
jgi:predicted flap endonuclease-1-like 5' DNA nuclease